ncbi:hypothetical protein R6H33_29625, partial [Klebsiella michiganensis]|uniref:hypothetical protein n=1 Tax=Klebsiella michiganensis TaxID=1134687 RepID=UPI00296690A5
YGIKIDHTERETTGVVGKAERLTWHKAWTMVSTGFSISYTSREPKTLISSEVSITLIAFPCFTTEV